MNLISEQIDWLGETPLPRLQADSIESVKRRILVLEDDPDQQRMLAKHLESVGFEILLAGSIAVARSLLVGQTVELAIFDVQLPDGSGLEFCQQLGDLPATAELPIIILSSMSTSDAVRRARASGGRYFVGKPYDPNVLLALIEIVLSDAT